METASPPKGPKLEIRRESGALVFNLASDKNAGLSTDILPKKRAEGAAIAMVEAHVKKIGIATIDADFNINCSYNDVALRAPESFSIIVQ